LDAQGLLATGLEEVEQQARTCLGLNAGRHLDAMVEAAIAQQVVHTARCARLLVPGAEHNTRDVRCENGARAHDAGLEGHNERRVGEVPITRCGRRGTDRDDLRMRGRILGFLALVPADGQPGTIRTQDESCNRNIARLQGGSRFEDGLAHPLFVCGHASSVR